MATRHPNYRLARVHRSYTVEETATLFGTHRNTVRDWIKRGLPTTDGKRPALILGRDLAAFLKARRLKNKRPCGPGQIYCVRCRVPKSPAGEMADYQPIAATLGNLVGICPTCDCMIFRRINLNSVERIRGNLDIKFPKGGSHISKSDTSSVNCDLLVKE